VAKKQDKNSKLRRELDEKYAIELYRSLLDYFKDVQVLTPESPSFIVEKIRNLAEFLVYGQEYE
jgi:hypothetical protein